MEFLLTASSDPLGVLALFGVALAVFHIVLIRRRTLSAAQWKLTEYAWSGLALLSLLGFVEEARFLRAANDLQIAHQATEARLSDLTRWVAVYDQYACEEGADDASLAPLCLWVKGRGQDLDLIVSNESFPPDVPANLLSGIDAVSGLGAADRKVVRAHLQGYVTARAQYLKDVADQQRSMLAHLVVAFAPLLFAVALALKVTKVTGEYRLAKRS